MTDTKNGTVTIENGNDVGDLATYEDIDGQAGEITVPEVEVDLDSSGAMSIDTTFKDTSAKKIALLGTEYLSLKLAETPKEQKVVVAALSMMVSIRTSIEKTRLKANRMINDEAGRLTEKVKPIELHVRTLRDEYAATKKKEKEEAFIKEKKRVDQTKALIQKSFGQKRVFDLQGKASVVIKTRLAVIRKVEVTEELFKEFSDEAQRIKEGAIASIELLLENQQKIDEAEKVRKEAEAKRLEADEKLAAAAEENRLLREQIDAMQRPTIKPAETKPEQTTKVETSNESDAEEVQPMSGPDDGNHAGDDAGSRDEPDDRPGPDTGSDVSTVLDEPEPKHEAEPEPAKTRRGPAKKRADQVVTFERAKLLNIAEVEFPRFIESIGFEITDPSLCAILVEAQNATRIAGEAIVDGINSLGDES